MLLIALTVPNAHGQSRMTRQEYIDKYKETAMEAMRTHGIPASITLAQGCLESGDGNSDLAVKANNHFGIQIPQRVRVLQGPLRLPAVQGQVRLSV